MRITKATLELPAVQRGKPIKVSIDGRKVQAYEGELVSTVLLAEGILTFRRKSGSAAGVCRSMGVCYECLVTGVNV